MNAYINMFQMVVLNSGHIFLKTRDVSLQTDNIFSYSLGCHVVLAIACSDGDNNAVSVRVNPVCGFFCIAAAATLGIGVLGSGGTCGF